METAQKRGQNATDIIDDRLSKYLSVEQLNELSDAEIEAINDFFSNVQLRAMVNMPVDVLKRQIANPVKMVERQRFTTIPIDEYDKHLLYLQQVCSEVEEVICPVHHDVIAVEVKHPDYDSREYFRSPNRHWQGRFTIPVGRRLMGYRMRHDDVMGYCCGTLIPNPAYQDAIDDWEKAVIHAREQWEKDDKLIATNSAEAEKEHYKFIAENNKKTGKDKLPPESMTEEFIPFAHAPYVPPQKPDVPEFIVCGNQDLMAEIEVEVIPKEHLVQNVVTEDDIIKIKRRIDETGYKKPVKKIDGGYKVDKFILRKVK